MPVLIALMWLPWTPPPTKKAEAQPLAIVQEMPASASLNLFADVRMVSARELRRMRWVRIKTVGGLPLVQGIAELK